MSKLQKKIQNITLAQCEKCLNYKDLQAGDILLYRVKDAGPVQKIISSTTNSVYTHAAICLGEGQVAEAIVPDGVQKSALSSALD